MTDPANWGCSTPITWADIISFNILMPISLNYFTPMFQKEGTTKKESSLNQMYCTSTPYKLGRYVHHVHILEVPLDKFQKA